MGPLAHSITALATLGAAPFGALALALVPRWRVGLDARLGAVPRAPGRAPGGLWVHAASVGETRACAPLVRAWCARGESLHVTHTRADALAIDVGADARRTSRALAPLEHPWCAARALAAVAPRAIALVETEIWPVGIRVAAERGVRVGVVSGALSERSFARYRALSRVFRPTFGRLAFVAARSEADAERFLALGVRAAAVAVTGDLKAELAARPAAAPPAALVRARGALRLVVAGSTHEGEEEAVLDAFARVVRARTDAACVVAPRDVARAPRVVAVARARGLRARLRSAGLDPPLAPGEVLVVDGLGELAAWYAVALVAFVGGTFAPVGGHNLWEPALAGAFVLHGPRIENVRDAAAELASSGAATAVDDARALAAALDARLADEAGTRARAACARAAREAAPSPLARTLAWVDAHVGAGPPAAAPVRSGA
ncbi:MAG: glycosyltransferase N-terminal domain-containing protein [Myxococcota bacterium]